jgi:hypothetical protein
MPKLSKMRAAPGFVLASSRTVLSLACSMLPPLGPFAIREQVSVEARQPNMTLVTPGISRADCIRFLAGLLGFVT